MISLSSIWSMYNFSNLEIKVLLEEEGLQLWFQDLGLFLIALLRVVIHQHYNEKDYYALSCFTLYFQDRP